MFAFCDNAVEPISVLSQFWSSSSSKSVYKLPAAVVEAIALSSSECSGDDNVDQVDVEPVQYLTTMFAPEPTAVDFNQTEPAAPAVGASPVPGWM